MHIASNSYIIFVLDVKISSKFTWI